MKNKLILLIWLFLSLFAVKCYAQDEQPYLNLQGTLSDMFQIGKDGGGIKWDYDSLAYKIIFKKGDGHLDSAWIPLSNIMSTPWSIRLEATQRAAADGNLLSQILLKASSGSVDTLESRVSYAESQILLKAGLDDLDGLGDSLFAELLLKANVASVDSVKDRLFYAESSIAAKANITALDSARSEIMAEVYLRARASYVDTLATQQDSINAHLSVAEAGISANAGQIIGLDGRVDSVYSQLLLYALKDSIISYINITPEVIKISSNKIELDGDVIATSLRSKTITGATVQTDTTGKRIVMAPDGTLTFYATNGTSSSMFQNVGNIIEFSGAIYAGNTLISNADLGVQTDKVTATSYVWGKKMYSGDPALLGGSFLIANEYGNGFFNTSLKVNSKEVATQEWVNSQGFATTLSETDPVFSAWDKSTGISITESQISDFGNYVTGTPWTGAGAVSYLDLNDVPSSFSPSTHGNEAHSVTFLTSESDPNVPEWAKAASKPSYSYSEVGAASSSHNHNTEYLSISSTPWRSEGYITATALSGYATEEWVDGLYYTADYISTNFLEVGSVTSFPGFGTSGTTAAYGNHNHSSFGGTINFTDNDGNDHTVSITNGIITNWEVH
jgi:hypothetical protein